MATSTLTQERLKELLDYDAETGVFRWRVDRKCGRGRVHCKSGDIAGHQCKAGYIEIRIGDRLYLGHRLAWLYSTGNLPRNAIDHINMDRGDNRHCNLRQANKSQNGLNRGKPSNNVSGVKGVSWSNRDKTWRAQLTVRGQHICIGSFKSREEAALAYTDAVYKHAGEFART